MKLKKTNRNLNFEQAPAVNRLRDVNGSTAELKEVLVPIDFSECSKHALRYALVFARQFNARVTLLSVVMDIPTSFDSSNPDYTAHLDSRKRAYSDELKKLVGKELGEVRHNIEVRIGRPYEEIAKAASDLNSDLIVISTHGTMGMTRAELGSTAERVVRYAPCPVLVVRQKEREFVQSP